MICHLAGLSAYIGIPVILPFFIWTIKKDRDPVVMTEGKESINFNLSFALYGFLAGILCYVLIGFALFPIIMIVHVVLVIWAVLKANKGEPVRYPLSLRFIK
jgi:uncharacterized Tic20 family protein